jgi:hypothetical protein
MAGITLTEAQAQLTAWMAASTAVASGQAYSMSSGAGSRSLTRADAKEIRENIRFWNDMVKSLSTGSTSGPQINTGIPRRDY